MRVRYSLFWQVRALAVETRNMVEQCQKAIKDLKYVLDNHLLHRLDDHEDKLKKIDGKLDVITKRLPPPQGEKT